MRRLAMRRRVLGPKWLVTMTRRPASGNRNFEGLSFMISSTITTDPRLGRKIKPSWRGASRLLQSGTDYQLDAVR
ncbi:hypothetical protein EYF80_040746 [Liparis tanakae]|uniref:Uncharacterized protein n=1 Tax=Liparis tanakae TaxID=230148 RepID=A0A4Z2G643_9TELE|nr:hypothetical protein EYF80_040746 [Liparis tanakae]